MNFFLASCNLESALEMDVETVQGRTTRITLPQPFAVVGRHPQSDLFIDVDGVRPRHAYLQVIEGKLFCINVAQTGSVQFQHGVRPFSWVQPGERLKIGQAMVRLNYKGTEFQKEINNPLAPESAWEIFAPKIRLSCKNEALNVEYSWVVDRLITLVGRTAICEVQLPDVSVSNVHASLVLTSDGLWIIDLLGRGSVKVNCCPVRSALLQEKDTFEIGCYKFKVSVISGSLNRNEMGKPPKMVENSTDSTGEDSAVLRFNTPERPGPKIDTQGPKSSPKMDSFRKMVMQFQQVSTKIPVSDTVIGMNSGVFRALDSGKLHEVQRTMDELQEVQKEIDTLKQPGEVEAGVETTPLHLTEPMKAEVTPEQDEASIFMDKAEENELTGPNSGSLAAQLNENSGISKSQPFSLSVESLQESSEPKSKTHRIVFGKTEAKKAEVATEVEPISGLAEIEEMESKLFLKLQEQKPEEAEMQDPEGFQLPEEVAAPLVENQPVVEPVEEKVVEVVSEELRFDPHGFQLPEEGAPSGITQATDSTPVTFAELEEEEIADAIPVEEEPKTLPTKVMMELRQAGRTLEEERHLEIGSKAGHEQATDDLFTLVSAEVPTELLANLPIPKPPVEVAMQPAVVLPVVADVVEEAIPDAIAMEEDVVEATTSRAEETPVVLDEEVPQVVEPVEVSVVPEVLEPVVNAPVLAAIEEVSAEEDAIEADDFADESMETDFISDVPEPVESQNSEVDLADEEGPVTKEQDSSVFAHLAANSTFDSDAEEQLHEPSVIRESVFSEPSEVAEGLLNETIMSSGDSSLNDDVSVAAPVPAVPAVEEPVYQSASALLVGGSPSKKIYRANDVYSSNVSNKQFSDSGRYFNQPGLSQAQHYQPPGGDGYGQYPGQGNGQDVNPELLLHEQQLEQMANHPETHYADYPHATYADQQYAQPGYEDPQYQGAAYNQQAEYGYSPQDAAGQGYGQEFEHGYDQQQQYAEPQTGGYEQQQPVEQQAADEGRFDTTHLWLQKKLDNLHGVQLSKWKRLLTYLTGKPQG